MIDSSWRWMNDNFPFTSRSTQRCDEVFIGTFILLSFSIQRPRDRFDGSFRNESCSMTISRHYLFYMTNNCRRDADILFNCQGDIAPKSKLCYKWRDGRPGIKATMKLRILLRTFVIIYLYIPPTLHQHYFFNEFSFFPMRNASRTLSPCMDFST